MLSHYIKKYVCVFLLGCTLASYAHAQVSGLAKETKDGGDHLAMIISTVDQTVEPHNVLTSETLSNENKKCDLWQRIRQGYGVPNLENGLVMDQLSWYSSHTAHILRTTERASLYLYHVVEELEKRGMPMELALLPFVESAFNPEAISSAKAAGMWQFIPSTGRDFNLRQTLFQDERRDILDSTDAALTYLQKLYDMFGDWHLALAAYNWGEGSVQRAIKKQQAAGLPVDFDSMRYLMPKETQNYVPKLQAIKNIIGYPHIFGITLPQLDNEPYFVAIDKTRDIDITVAAQLAELTVDEFKRLNPQFNRPVITGSADTKILLPTEHAEIYKENLSKWAGPLSSWTTYTVQQNEKLENIALRLGVSLKAIQEANRIPRHMRVKIGSTLLVPKSEADGEEEEDIAQHVLDHASLNFAHDNIKTILIKYKKKDTLQALAKRYKVSVAQIKAWNRLENSVPRLGQSLRLELTVNRAAKPAYMRQVALKKIKSTATFSSSKRIRGSKKVSVAHFKSMKRRSI